MTRRCTSRAIDLFYQTITEVNISTKTSTKQFFSLSHRKLGSVRHSHPNIDSVDRFRRSYSSSYQETSKKAPNSYPHRTDDYIGSTKTTENLKDETSDVFVEVSPEGINQLAAEIAAEQKDGMLESNWETSSERRKNIYPKTNNFESTEISPLADLMRDRVEKKPPRSNIEFISIKEDKKKYAQGLPDLRLSKLQAAKKKMSQQPPPPPREPWMIEKERIKLKYPDGYMPLKRLSPDAVDGIRALHAHMPERFTTAMLAKEFKVSPEAIQRILRSKWRPKADEAIDREARWFRRGEQIWSRWADLGATPPARFRKLGIGQRPRIPPYKPDPLPELITTPVRRKSEEKGFPEINFDMSIL